MGRVILPILAGAALALAEPAVAQSSALSLDIRGGPLADALLDLSRQANLELLFDRGLMIHLKAAPIRGRLTPEAALQRLLQDTGLALRRSPSGIYVVEAPVSAPLARQDVTVPEVLVIGRRSQNADIRRLESDIQPYRVATGREIQQAGADNLDQFFRSRLPANTVTLPPSLDLNGETTSEVDLRGLGSGSTLVLVDGRRMPAIPAQTYGFRQSDLNAIPLHAIARVEVLTGAAGGVYGYGAQGGVINVVLARGGPGAELHATTGVSSRGDARQAALEGRIAFAANEGRTEASLFAAASRSEPLLTGERDFMTEDVRLSTGLAPRELISFWPNASGIFVSNTLFGPPLQLKPAYGGAVLSSYLTYLPTGSSGDPAQVAAALVQNAGQFAQGLSDGDAASGLTSTPRTESLLANVRHRFESGAEAYLDAILLWNHGRYEGEQSDGTAVLPATSPFNPFVQAVQVAYPIEGATRDRTTRFDTARYTAGLVSPLPFDWRATAEAALGSARYRYVERFSSYSAASSVPVNPFGSWADLQAALQARKTELLRARAIRNEFRDLSLRLAGPVFQTPAGPALLTLLAERRTEDVPLYENLQPNFGAGTNLVAPRRTTMTSVYGELRARIFGDTAPAPYLRDLEVQLAVRNDRQIDDFARTPTAPATTERLRGRFQDTVVTLGAKVSPARWLTLRGSYATGASPPPLANQIESVTVRENSIFFTNDAKRGGRGSPGSLLVTVKSGGSSELETILVETTSLGGIVTPFGEDGPRLTLDYSRIRKTRDLFAPDFEAMTRFEELWPQRVVRGPLSDADRTQGYTAGPILYFDTRVDNSARVKIDTLDARLDWRLPLLDGELRLRGDTTYYIRQVRSTPLDPGTNVVDYLSRPLSRRGTLGVEWTDGAVTLGANLQHFGGYRIYPPGTPAASIQTAVNIQGEARVPSQTYLDLNLGWQGQVDLAGRPQDMRIDLAVINVLDKAPPRESTVSVAPFLGAGPPTQPAYSRHGDPRRRRLVLTLSAAF